MNPTIVYNANLSASGEKFISLRKPREFFAGLPVGLRIHHLVSPATPEEIKLAHDPRHVDAVLEGRSANGFGGTLDTVNRQVMWANGAMVEAVRLALAMRTGVCAPVSGFHHAGYNYSGGFCTFNGLMVADAVARSNGFTGRTLIYDGDAHFGDGCVDILDRLREKSNIGGQITYVGRGSGIDDEKALDQLRGLAKGIKHYDLVLYQAGMDAYINDPMRAGYLTKLDLEERDRTIFSACHETGTPLVWNLAGGYHETETVELHLQSWRVFARVYGG